MELLHDATTMSNKRWAEMQMIYDKAQSLMYRVLTEAAVDPTKAALRRAWSTMVAIMEGAPEMSLAIRVCGGRSMLRPNKLEQHYRDALRSDNAALECRSLPRPTWSI